MAQSRGFIDVDLEGQVAALRKELGALRRMVARRGSALYDEAGDTASDYFRDLYERAGSTLSPLRRQARAVERATFDHPAIAAAVGLVVIGLVASLLVGMRPSSKPAPNRRSKAKARPARSS